MDWTPLRRESLRRSCVADPLDAMLVTSSTNVRYLTGFTGEDAALILTGERDVIVSDGRFTTQIAEECHEIEAHIRPIGQSLFDAVAEVIGKLGVHRLGFEAPALSMAAYETLRAAIPSVDTIGLRHRVEALRAVKDCDEIAAIRTAIDQAERAFAMLRNSLRPGETEKDVADALEANLRRCGASSASFPPIVAVGRRAALPHARPTAQARIGEDDFVLIDWGATDAPYKSDLTRVLVTGKVTPTFETLYRTVLAAQERGIAAIRPGVSARDVDAEARSVIEEAGFGGFFPHGLGHGLGMDIHEAPWLRKGVNAPLVAGMVVTVEPGIYLPDWGGIRIEDDVLVTLDGCEVLTRVPRSLDSVRTA